MREYLNRFGDDRAKVRDLLMPLAFAEGDGLAKEALWAALASELGIRTYQAQDLSWLLKDTSAPNLLQPTELIDGTVAWRLFHEALAEYLRDELHWHPREAQRRITQVLADRVPTRSGRREWLAADAYTRAHLPIHATAARRLDEFVGDPGVLLAAEPARLLWVLPTVTSSAAQAAASAYQQAAHQLGSDLPLGQRASCLQRAAHYCGAWGLDERIPELGIGLPWTTRWAHWQASGVSRQLTGHTGGVEAVALGAVYGQPVIVVGGKDGTVRVWDARSGKLRGKPLTGHTGEVTSVALGAVDGRPVIMSGGADRTVRVWDARSGKPRGKPLTGHTERVPEARYRGVSAAPGVLAVTFGVVGGRPVIVSGGRDGTVRVWDAHSGDHCRIEADAEAHGVVCLTEGLIVAATSLGLAVFQLTTAADTPGLPAPNETRL